tara:strand:- start:609 stop:1997 length:1389 start_codon:yes stop_codon:yes gene_type:complete
MTITKRTYTFDLTNQNFIDNLETAFSEAGLNPAATAGQIDTFTETGGGDDDTYDYYTYLIDSADCTNSGSGTGSLWKLWRSSNGQLSTTYCINPGSGYAVNDTITVPASLLSGVEASTITVTGIKAPGSTSTFYDKGDNFAVWRNINDASKKLGTTYWLFYINGDDVYLGFGTNWEPTGNQFNNPGAHSCSDSATYLDYNDTTDRQKCILFPSSSASTTINTYISDANTNFVLFEFVQGDYARHLVFNRSAQGTNLPADLNKYMMAGVSAIYPFDESGTGNGDYAAGIRIHNNVNFLMSAQQESLWQCQTNSGPPLGGTSDPSQATNYWAFDVVGTQSNSMRTSYGEGYAGRVNIPMIRKYWSYGDLPTWPTGDWGTKSTTSYSDTGASVPVITKGLPLNPSCYPHIMTWPNDFAFITGHNINFVIGDTVTVSNTEIYTILQVGKNTNSSMNQETCLAYRST